MPPQQLTVTIMTSQPDLMPRNEFPMARKWWNGIRAASQLSCYS